MPDLIATLGWCLAFSRPAARRGWIDGAMAVLFAAFGLGLIRQALAR